MMRSPAAIGTAAPGTRPEGVPEEQAAQYVRDMFEQIAPRYDLANHLLSMNIDRYWRWRSVRLVRAHGVGPERPVVDLCCGTGDLTIALDRGLPPAPVIGSDFTHGMLTRARNKGASPRVSWMECDAMRLPFAGNSVGVFTTAFGFRNLVDYRGALRELYRALQPGGLLLILECSRPSIPVLGPLYDFYFRRLVPLLGGWITGSRSPYQYLPASVSRFPLPRELAQWMQDAGYEQVRFRRLTGGIVSLHTAVKPRG
jgi:demethylmenaquinone methyltransferase/2-methoxy-6-polyprenyl-1,4-benzoquinol methylase